MNKSLLIALPLIALLTIGSIACIVYKKHHVKPAANNTTIFDWYSCSNGLNHAQCDDLSNETQKSECYGASKLVSDLTYADNESVLASCKQFYTFLKDAQTNDALNTESYYQNCFVNSQVLKDAATNSYFNENIYTPFYIKCAGF